MPKTEPNEELAARLRTAMNYRENALCENCRHFTGLDYSGEIASRHNLCTLNQACDVRVSPKGYCKFFSPRKPDSHTKQVKELRDIASPKPKKK